MKLKRIMIAAPKSGSGKTTITCALLKALKNRGERVASYKCGPDYIDPMFHEQVIGIPSKNLDTFFTDEKTTRALLLHERKEEDFAVLEGVMGLFDGLGGIREEGSSYHLAKVTETPVLLIIDAKGMGRSVIPLIAGFLAYDRKKLIQGIIFNKMSKAYYEIIKPLVEEELKVQVLGYFPKQKDIRMESRHLGLVMPNELTNIQEKLQAASEELVKTVSLEAIMQIAEQAGALPDVDFSAIGQGINERDVSGAEAGLEKEEKKDDRPVIGVARDEAFCFYYADNLLMLKQNGARIKYFSPLYDAALPTDCHGLLLGGGYPELYADELSKNTNMRAAIKQAFQQGMPIVAECGGFMYLHDGIIDQKGTSHAMAGVIPAVCTDQGKLVRFGYIEIKEKESCFLPEGERIKGHEFHYFDSTDNGSSCIAVKPAAKREYPCIIEGENYWLGFPHLYYPSNPSFARIFVEKAKKYKELLFQTEGAIL